jgi:hypothetical protein
MKYYWCPGYTQDGKLDQKCGRIVIFGDDCIVLTRPGSSSDHNDILRGLASKYRLKTREVIHNAIRLYYRREHDTIIINGVRRIDDDALENKLRHYAELIRSEIE